MLSCYSFCHPLDTPNCPFYCSISPNLNGLFLHDKTRHSSVLVVRKAWNAQHSSLLVAVEIPVERPILLPRQPLVLFPAVPQVRLMRGLMTLLSGCASPSRLSACREIAIA